MKELDRTQLKILDFDIENRPSTYWVADMCTAEITAIATSWIGNKPVQSWLLRHNEDHVEMLEAFLKQYNEADMVTGHYIRKHDLPIINAHLVEYGYDPLEEKLTQDTKLDMVKKKDMSASQEALSAMYDMKRPKHHLTQADWREMNRLTERGLEITEKRVTEDVKQHKELRANMIEFNALKAPKVWRP